MSLLHRNHDAAQGDTVAVTEQHIGRVLHMRVRGRNAAGDLVVAACDGTGKELRPARLAVLPGSFPWVRA